jgi:gliding motility-associated-like protein
MSKGIFGVKVFKTINHVDHRGRLFEIYPGQNDYWDASILPDYYKFTLYIYDRQGKLILDLPKYKNNFYGLDTEDNDLPNGIYFYRFVNPDNDMEFKGYIQIIKYF